MSNNNQQEKPQPQEKPESKPSPLEIANDLQNSTILLTTEE